MTALFEVQELTIGVRERVLLQGLSFALAVGERLALRGPSGLGKTTLLRAMSGLVDPLGGRVLLEGSSPADLGWPEYRRRVVFVAQTPVLFEGSVEDNLARPFSFRAATSAFDRERAALILERVSLDAALLRHDATSLSVGQKQRVCLVRALLLDPALLVLDEPTSALDDANRESVETLLTEADAAAIVVTHDSGFARRLGARSLELAPHAPHPRGLD